MLAWMKSIRQVRAGEVCRAPMEVKRQAGPISIRQSTAVSRADRARRSFGQGAERLSQTRSTLTRSPLR